ncbi:hypothetical protein SNE40_005189 [Patella caerulea]|uniref:Uncharacterized protein n=1 Tax=Patella caerulea TaxID=87958 RepID=A0AAN8JHW3_PATCE
MEESGVTEEEREIEEEEMEEESFQDKITEEFEALKYFSMFKLKEYENKIEDLHKKREENDQKVATQMKEMQEKMQELEKSKSVPITKKPEDIQLAQNQSVQIPCHDTISDEDEEVTLPVKRARPSLTLTHSTPKRPQFRVPQSVMDLSIEWQDKLRPHTVTPQKSDLLTEAQLTFFTHWANQRPNLLGKY